MSAVVYSKGACGYCIRVKHVLKSKGVEIKEQKIGEDISKEEVANVIGKDFQTVPQVMIDGQYIGGYEEVCKHFDIKVR